MFDPPAFPDADDETTADGLPLGLKIFLAVIGMIVVGFVILHLAGGGLAGHGMRMLPRNATAQSSTMPDSVAVVTLIAAFHDGLAGGDSAAVLALLAPEALILEGGELETREEYRAHHLANDIAATRVLAGARVVRRVAVIGDAAWVASTSTSRGSMRGRELDLEGVELVVLERRSGVWRIGSIHWSARQRRTP